MATRLRQQSATPSVMTSRGGGGGGFALPPYEAPQFPLNPTAQRALAQLGLANDLKNLDKELIEAQAAVSNSAAEINDRLTLKERDHKKQLAKKRNRPSSQGADEGTENEDAERSLEELRDKVERMTSRMEDSMRKLIDGQHSVQHIKDSINSVSDHARVNASTQVSTQGRTQRRRTQAAGSDDEDDGYHDFEPTDPAAGTQAHTSAIDKFRQDMDTAKTRYQAYSLTERYADNPRYRDFRRVVHDAQHPDDEGTLPHHSEWFPEGERPAPGVMNRRARPDADEAADSDDDIAVSKATISTKCPLTLQEFKDPLTSTKCPHNFEREAILQMISAAKVVQVDGSRPQKAVQCPVSGCSKMLTKEDLQVDKVAIRKIKRLQEAARLAEEEEDDDNEPGTQGGATLIDDDDDGADVDDVVEGRPKATQVKGEPTQTARSSQRRAGGGVVDLAADTSDDEAEEEDTMEEE